MSAHYSNVSASSAASSQKVYDIFLRDLSSIQSSKSYASNTYLEGQAYCLLFMNELKFYFVNNGNVVNIDLPHTFEVTSAQNIFLYQVDPAVLGINGYVAVAFGLNNHMLIHIDPQYTQPQSYGYQIIWLKEYTLIQMNNQRDCVSVVKQAEILTATAPRSSMPIQELTFFLGQASQQKVIHLKVSLRMDIGVSASSFSSILTSTEENIVHLEAKGLVSRVSNFFSSKLGYGETEVQESSGCVKDIHVFNNFVIIITTKDLIVIRRVDGLKLYEKEYMDSMKQWSERNDQYLNQGLMRQLLDFKLVTTSSVYLRHTNSLCINLFALKTQVVQSSYQDTIKQSHVIQRPITFFVNEGQTEIEERVEHGAGIYFFYDLDKFSNEEIFKTFSFSYELLSQTQVDVATLLFLEYANGKTLTIDHSFQNTLENVQVLKSNKLHGINAQTYFDETAGDQAVLVTLISSNDIDFYEFFSSSSQFSMTKPESITERLRIAPLANVPIGYQGQSFEQREQQLRIFKREELKPHIYSLLEKIATYKYGLSFKQLSQEVLEETERQIQAEIRQSLDIHLNQVNKLDYISEIRDILLEALDQQINDTQFQSYLNSSNEVQQIFQDEGLVQASLDSKGKKLDVIEEFLMRFLISENSMERDQIDRDMIEMVTSLRFKLFIAKVLRNKQEQIKEENNQIDQSRGVRGQYYPLSMRLLSTAIQFTAQKLEFSREKLRQLGVTSATVVYSKISQFEKVIQTLIDLSSDQNIHLHLQLFETEDSSQAAHEGAQILIYILEEALDKEEDLYMESFFKNNPNFLGSMFELSKKLSDAIKENEANQPLKDTLMQYADLFMISLNKFGLYGDQDYKIWLTRLAIFIEDSIGPQEALDFVDKFEEQKQLCRLVFELGKSKYEYIHRNVERWAESGFLFNAMETIYDQEKSVLQLRQKGNINCTYRGFQMFDIFEELYYPQLRDFLTPRNKKLLALLNLRHQESDEANLILKQNVIPNIKGVETMKALSSLAVSNNENCVQAASAAQKLEDHTYYKAKLNLAQTQSMVLPDEEYLIPISVDYLYNIYKNLQNTETDLVVFKRLFSIINNENVERDDFNELKSFLWSIVVRSDSQQICVIEHMLPSNPDDLSIHTEQSIENAIEGTLLYRFAELNQRNQSKLDDYVEAVLLQDNSDLQRGLNAIFALLRQRFGNLFQLRQSTQSAFQRPHDLTDGQSLFYN